jgi:dynein heavy chain
MKKESFYQYKSGVQEANERLEFVSEEIVGFEKELEDFDYFSKMFSF